MAGSTDPTGPPAHAQEPPVDDPSSGGAPADTGTTAWHEYLTALSVAVQRSCSALSQDDPDRVVVGFLAPARPVQPLEACDRERTAAVLGELRQLVQLLAAAQREVGTQLARSRRRTGGRTTTSSAHYLDGYG